jgi:hypothetical protein
MYRFYPKCESTALEQLNLTLPPHPPIPNHPPPANGCTNPSKPNVVEIF